MKKKLLILSLLLFLIPPLSLPAQDQSIFIKVYDFDEGLSHRNVFKVVQDETGFIWIASINGLNRFDGYKFLHYNSTASNQHIPHDVISDMIPLDKNRLLLGHPNRFTELNTQNNSHSSHILNNGQHVRRTAKVPHNIYKDSNGAIWMATYNETSAETIIQKKDNQGKVNDILTTRGQYTKRPITQFGNHIYIGVYENELWQFSLDGKLIQKRILSFSDTPQSSSRIIQFQATETQLWILLADGSVYSMNDNLDFEAHQANKLIPKQQNFSTFLVSDNNNLWIGGRGILLYYDNNKNVFKDIDPEIKELTKNTCQYRQIFKDRSGTIWIASDFGLIKLEQFDKRFTHYLSGGSEYCSDLYCSTRGITEDHSGNIYISYYNSIHKLDPKTNSIQPLFPSGDFFNYPFGLEYYNNALWTGNGLRIDLTSLRIDTIVKTGGGEGAVMLSDSGQLWFGHHYNIQKYDHSTGQLSDFEDSEGKWDSINGQISYLYNGSDAIWVGTSNNGLTRLDTKTGTRKTFNKQSGHLAHDKVIAIYEDNTKNILVATGLGIHHISPDLHTINIYNTENGLPNDFINGILPEGDSVVWASTDLGLCRFNYLTKESKNFFLADGLSANEFNRISFYKSTTGRMYFGGLNGVNAFFPGPEFLLQKQNKRETPLLITSFTTLNGQTDSLIEINSGLNNLDKVTFTHRDKFFTVEFSLADYRNPSQNIYSYQLQGYDEDWSAPSSVRTVRYNSLPAGNYTFRVRAKAGREDWNEQEIAVKVKVLEAFYNTTWFKILGFLITAGLVFGFFKYRIYRIQKRERELETLVQQRTKALEKEKQKSEELLLNILPAETADELKKHGVAKAKRHQPVTVMFSDFEGFSRISEQLEPEELVALIDRCFRAFDEITEKHGLEKIKTVGDAYLCVGGIVTSDENLAINMINAALEIQKFMENLANENEPLGLPFFRARIGINTGPVVAGIVGFKKFAYDIWGDTVNVASRMETYGAVDRVNISETTYNLVKDKFNCTYHGDFKEHDKVIKMYLVEE